MAHWREKTLDDVVKGFTLYRPFIAVVAAVVLVAAVLPGTKSDPGATSGATTGVTTDAGAAGTDAGAADGTATSIATADTVAGGGTGAGAGGATAGGGSKGTVAGGGTASAGKVVSGSAGVNSEAALSNPSCDRATKRIRVPTQYAPPCLPPFSGANGGSSWQGVTKDTIKIVVYLPQADPASGALLDAAGISDTEDQIKQTTVDFVNYFQAHYETYGRKIVLVWLTASGADADDASAKADAIKVASEIKAFASWGGRVLTNAYQDELAARGVLCICPKAPPIQYYQSHAPYYYSGLMASTQGYTHRAEFIGKKLWNKNAKYAGDPLMQGQKRKIGLVYTETAAGDIKPGVDFFQKELTKYGAHLDDAIPLLLDLTREQEQARTIITRLKQKGITTVALATTYLDPIFLTKEATNQGYTPEWLVVGSALTDTTVWARLYDQAQWSHAFGMSLLAGRVATEKTDPWSLYVWQYGRTPPADDTFAVVYAAPFMFFTGLHLAGPVLNPTTFRDGMFAFPPSGGGLTNALISYGRHSIWAFDDYSANDDGTEVWWDVSAQGPDETGATGTGMYRYVDGGKRYRPGGWQAGDVKAFNTAGTVTVYPDVPAVDKAPSYPPPKR
jgi:hypothetical protein